MQADISHRAGRSGWSVFTMLLLALVFTETIFAGALLSGLAWARAAHAATALLLFVSATGGGLGALVALRGVPQGARLGFTLVFLGLLLVLQAFVGKAIAQGANLLWLHVPLGVALVGLTAQAAAAARRLGEA